jgi:type VI secretion system protein VasG
MPVNLRALVARLNVTCRNAMEGAARLCLSRKYCDVEIEHVLLKLLEVDNSDIRRILRQFDVAPERLEKELEQIITGFKSGNRRTPALSGHIPELLEQASKCASIAFGESKIRSGHILVALVAVPALRRRVPVRCLGEINVETLQQNFHALVEASTEAREARSFCDGDGAPLAMAGEGSEGSEGGSKPSATPNLDKFCSNLKARAREGKLDTLLGRDEEIRQLVDILTRRRQNSPILTGEPGVGKTAVAEGLAARIPAGGVPPILKNVELLSLDLGMLPAGASVKSEFEADSRARLRRVDFSSFSLPLNPGPDHGPHQAD